MNEVEEGSETNVSKYKNCPKCSSIFLIAAERVQWNTSTRTRTRTSALPSIVWWCDKHTIRAKQRNTNILNKYPPFHIVFPVSLSSMNKQYIPIYRLRLSIIMSFIHLSSLSTSTKTGHSGHSRIIKKPGTWVAVRVVDQTATVQFELINRICSGMNWEERNKFLVITKSHWLIFLFSSVSYETQA